MMLFNREKPLIGVLELLPLPGSASWKGTIEAVITRAEQEATAMATGGLDAIILENTFDAPHSSGRIDVASAIAIGLITRRIMNFTPLPIGICVQKNDPESALAIAMNVGAKFIRVPLLTGAGLWEGGIVEGKFRELLAYKNRLGAEHIATFADISLSKLPPLALETSKPTLLDLAKAAVEVGGADGIIIVDADVPPQLISQLAQQLPVPVLYHFNDTISAVSPYLEAASGLVVGHSLKKNFTLEAHLPPAVDLSKVEELIAIAESLQRVPITTGP